METIVYLIRHSEKVFKELIEYNSNDSLLLQSEKLILSVEGERKAAILAKASFLQSVSTIYSSNYVRTLGTAKYLAKELELKITVDDRFGEIILGDYDPKKLELIYYNQFHDFDYKLPKGESFNDVKKRMNKAFNEVVNMHMGEVIAIFTHDTAKLAFLSAFCQVGYNLDDDIILTFNDELTFTRNWSMPDIIKLTLDDRNIINIERIELDYNW